MPNAMLARHATDPAHQNATAALGLHQRMRADLRSEAPSDL
jgi:hypothetical protein